MIERRREAGSAARAQGSHFQQLTRVDILSMNFPVLIVCGMATSIRIWDVGR